MYRLTQELIAQPPGPNVSISYAYDAAGNRTQMNRNGTVTTYAYDGNDRLLTETTGATTFTSTYDDNGNLKSRGDGVTADTYAYDAENRLIGASSAAGAATFTYDADGMRTGRTVGGVTTTFLLDKAAPAAACRCASDAQPPLAQVLVETRGANVVRYTHGHALIGQTQPGSGASFHLADGQRSHRQLTNAAGTVTDTYDFDAFGVLLAAGGSTPNVYLYAGEQLDPNLGFYYLRARHYQQATGRFVSTDPELGNFFDPMSLHRYLYAHANPVDNRDPSGRADYNLTSLMFAQVLAKSIGVGFIATIGTRALGIAKDWNTALTYGAGFTLVGLTWFGGTAVLAANELAAAGAAGTTAIPAGMLNSFLLAVETGEMADCTGNRPQLPSPHVPLLRGSALRLSHDGHQCAALRRRRGTYRHRDLYAGELLPDGKRSHAADRRRSGAAAAAGRQPRLPVTAVRRRGYGSLATPCGTWPAGPCLTAESMCVRWSSKKMSAPNAESTSPLSSPPRKNASSMRMFQARSVRITRSCAGALRAVTSAVRIGLLSSGKSDWIRCSADRNSLNGPPDSGSRAASTSLRANASRPCSW